MEWNNEMIIDYIQLYEEEPAIWNPRDAGHKNRNNVHDAWARIKAKFGDGRVSLQELKNKKDNLMATYRKLHAKVKSSLTSGSGTGEVFIPNWPFYEQMAKFLHGVYNPVKSLSSEDHTDSDAELNEEVACVENSESSSNSESIDSGIFKKPINGNLKKEGNKKRKIEHQIEHAYEVLKKISAEPEPVEDECTLYTKLLCAKLKPMDTMTRDIAMHEIDNIMFRLKQQQLEFQQGLPRFPNSLNHPYARYQFSQYPMASNYRQNMQSSVDFETSPYQPSTQSHSQQHTSFQPSTQSHSQQSADSQPSPQSHSQRHTSFQPSPQSHSQSSDVEEYTYSQPQPVSDFKSASEEQSMNQLYSMEVSKIFNQSE